MALDAALTEAHDAGISVVAASGNKKVDSCSVSPSRVSTVVSVAATNRTDAFWFPPSGDSGSNYGKCIDILAPVSKAVNCIHTWLLSHDCHVYVT